MSDLQSDIAIENDEIAGTLNFIADYSSAGYTGDEVSGNFLALHFEVPDVDDVTITVELVNGVHGPVTLDADGLAVCRIADKSTQTIKVVASKSGCETVTKEFGLSGLTCLSE